MNYLILKIFVFTERKIYIENIISVSQNKCKQCYSCVKNCPVNAIQIKNGQAEIMFSRCINCGICINSCPQNAKVVINSIDKCFKILNNNNRSIVCLAPSFIASFHLNNYKKVIGALKEVGFDEVWEVALGAEALTEEISKFIDENNQQIFLSSACPAIVTMFEKHYPELIKYLLPFVSPMIATGKIIRKKYINEKIDIVFIGPCVAKKAEIITPKLEGIINCVLTFEEIKEIFKNKKIEIENAKESDYDSQNCSKGKLFSLPGGLLENLSSMKKIDKSNYILVEGEKNIFNLIDSLKNNHQPFKFVDLLMCNGCIEGPKIDSKLNYFDKINAISNYYEETKNYTVNDLNFDVDLRRTYRNRRNILPFPTEDQIKAVLESTNKFTPYDELNCGACGYSTCREKAIAVVQGIAEVDMCLPYLLSKKNDLLDILSIKLKEITLLKDELETIIESSYDGLVISDSEGKILKSNKSFNKMIGLCSNNNELIDMNIQNIEEKKIIVPSTTLLALKEKRRISYFQSSKSGKKYLSTATPIFDNDGNISRVVTNIRDIENLNKLRDQIRETKKLEKYHEIDKSLINNIDFNSDNIVVNSAEFGETLQIASNVSRVDSTILIFGESGVGKEVVVKLIHRLSKRRNKPFIEINCGAIPDNLIESELFGYDSGAFTGAQKKGKPGLIELANEGTLFLDEIGELPTNVQVKFLRVIQEKKLIRIGGTKEKKVDVRIIAATNKNLFDMVQKGTFRADLYYRLNVVPIEIPPLRKRKADILPLCHHFLQIFNNKYQCDKTITSSVENILYNYEWPGNVRELENLIERLVVTISYDIIDDKSLPLFLFNSKKNIYNNIKIDSIIPLKEAKEIIEKLLIKEAYKKYKTTYEMAKVLGVNQSTVVRKMQKYLDFNAYKHD